MPIFSTNRGHIDEERVRTIVGRLLESLGRNEKSIWDHYNEMAAMEDDTRDVEWGDFAEVILVFDGLFAAVISAFLISTIPRLQANSTDIALDVLIHISRQLGNSTIPAYTQTEFTLTQNAFCVNALLSVSLICIVVDAIVAMLIKMWLRELGRELRQHTVADLRAKERERRMQGLKRWKLDRVLPLLPLLLLVSIVLFFCGIIVNTLNLHFLGAIAFSIVLGLMVTAYFFTIFVPIFDPYAPFSTMVSSFVTGVLLRASRVWTSPSAIRDIIYWLLSADPSRATAPPSHGSNIVSSAAQPTVDEGVKL